MGRPRSVGANGCGVLFALASSGTLTVLYNLCAEAGCSDGKGPNGLTLGNDGNLYGVTATGGTFGRSATAQSSSSQE
jgi:hypothetical protein